MAKSTWIDLGLSYDEAAHGMQSAVLWEMQLEEVPLTNHKAAASPKHLRVGVNSAMVEHSALAHLLMTKGIITEAEFLEELRLAMNHELATFEKRFGHTFR